MTTYNELINLFENITLNQINYFKGFGHGGIEKIDAVVNQGYPLLFVRPMSSPGLTGVDGRQRELVFEIYSLDVPKISIDDNRVALSNTEQGLLDFYATLLDGPSQYDVQVIMNGIVPALEVFQDRAVGWVMTITIITDAVGVTYCDIS